MESIITRIINASFFLIRSHHHQKVTHRTHSKMKSQSTYQKYTQVSTSLTNNNPSSHHQECIVTDFLTQINKMR